MRKAIIQVVLVAAIISPRPQDGRANPTEEHGAIDRITCYVSIIPQAFFVGRIGGDYVDLHVMVGPGEVPHTYEPKSRQLAQLAQAQIYFSIGVAFEESLLPRIERNFKSLRIVDTCAGVQKRSMAHTHGGDAKIAGETREGFLRTPSPSEARRKAGYLDPHAWLSPRIAISMCANIRDALAVLDPSHAGYFAARFDELERDLEEVDREVARVLSPFKGRDIFVYHPAYGYFTDAYGLIQIEIEENGSIPGPRHLAEVIDRAKAARARVIFVQPQVSDTYARTVADAIGGRVVSLDPLAERYTENLLIMARRVAESFDAR